MKIDVLYEDNHCLVVNKPAGLLSQADATGDPCLVSWARDYLKGAIRSRETSMSGWSTDWTVPRRAPSCWPARARRQAVFRTGSDPARFPRPTGPSSRDSRSCPRASGMTSWRRTGDSTGFACSTSQPEKGSWPGCTIESCNAEGGCASSSCVRTLAAVINCEFNLPDEDCRSWGTVSMGRRPFSRPRTVVAGSR